MKLFVTGATGFIGSHFLNLALREGHQVVALRRNGSQSRIPLTTNFPGFLQWIEKEMPKVSTDDFAGCEVLVHLAAHSANVPYDNLENCLHWNVQEPLALFRKAYSSGLTHFLVAGSCFEYGRSGERYEFIPTDAPLEPTQTYPASKAAASIAFHQLAVELDLKLSILRIFQVFGEGEAESRFWPSLRKAALTGQDFPMTSGEQVRDFVPVEEVARQLLTACFNPPPHGSPQIRHVGTGNPQSLRTFAENWWKHWHAQGSLAFGAIPYRHGEVMRFVPKV